MNWTLEALTKAGGEDNSDATVAAQMLAKATEPVEAYGDSACGTGELRAETRRDVRRRLPRLSTPDTMHHEQDRSHAAPARAVSSRVRGPLADARTIQQAEPGGKNDHVVDP